LHDPSLRDRERERERQIEKRITEEATSEGKYTTSPKTSVHNSVYIYTSTSELEKRKRIKLGKFITVFHCLIIPLYSGVSSVTTRYGAGGVFEIKGSGA
jgi:hypothetical protein